MAFKESLDRAVKVFSSRRLHTVTPPTSVSQIMTRDVLSVYPGQGFAEAMGLMANRPFRHFLVIHHTGRLAGVISDRDLLRVMGATTDWKREKSERRHDPGCSDGDSRDSTFGRRPRDVGASSELPASALR